MRATITGGIQTAQGMLTHVKRQTSGQEKRETQETRETQAKPRGGTYDTISLSSRARAAGTAGRSFSSLSELDAYLKEKHPAYSSGSVSVSKSVLHGCLEDGDRLASLEEDLKSIPEILENTKKNLPKNTKLLSCTVTIDEDGVKTETLTSTVYFNAAKRAAELSGAMTVADVGMVLAKLQKDLSDVKSGGGDRDTIRQVKRLIRKAEEKMKRLEKDDENKNGGAHEIQPMEIMPAPSFDAAAPVQFGVPIE